MENVKEKEWKIVADGRVFAVEFSPFNWSGSLIAFATRDKISVGSCVFEEEDVDVEEGFEYQQLREFPVASRVHALAWSPETSLTVIPKILRFATGSADFMVRVYTSRLKDGGDVVVKIKGHTDYINDVIFEPTEGHLLASVSDDHTCRVWDIKGESKMRFPLKSPGVSVGWHMSYAGRLMVAEKIGVIRLYNTDKQQPIISLDCSTQPLMAADWCMSNSFKIGCIASNLCFEWDINISCLPVEQRQSQIECGRYFRWGRSNDNLVAIGRPYFPIKVFHMEHKKIFKSGSLPITSGPSWHFKLPIVAVAGDGKIHLRKVDTF